MLKNEKAKLVEKLSKELKDAKSAILVNYAGLNVKAQQELKGRLRESGSKMVVVKNTLLKRAAEEAKLDEKMVTDTVLSGQTALILSGEDAVAPVQILGKFAKEFELPKFKVGVVEGSFQDEAGLKTLSTLPGRDALLGQLLGALMASEYGLVGTLNANMQKLVFVLSEASKK